MGGKGRGRVYTSEGDLVGPSCYRREGHLVGVECLPGTLDPTGDQGQTDQEVAEIVTHGVHSDTNKE